MAYDPLNKILDTIHDSAIDVWAFIKYPVQTTAAKTAWAYFKLALAGTAKMFPAMAVFLSGQTTIQQESVRKPDEHIQSSVQSPDTVLEASNALEVASANAMPFQVFAWDDVRVGQRDKGLVQLVTETLPPPLPLITASDKDSGTKA